MNNLKLQTEFLKKLHKGDKIFITVYNEKEYITDGYGVYLLEDNFLNLGNIKTYDGLLDRIISENNVEIEFTNSIRILESPKRQVYIFRNKDESIFVDKKFFKQLDNLDKYTFYGNKSTSPVLCYKDEILEAVILPIRITD